MLRIQSGSGRLSLDRYHGVVSTEAVIGRRRICRVGYPFVAVDDELVLDELLVLLDFFFLSSSSSSSSSSFFVGVDGARFGVDSLLRVSVRVLVLVTSRFGFACVLGFVCVLLSRVLLVGVLLTF